jgi:NAD(P)-dependent dehydrogenase (short-subunit alcohol dehydrogenase family)
MQNPFYRETSYRISKAGLVYYAEVLAIELAPYGIRVSTHHSRLLSYQTQFFRDV